MTRLAVGSKAPSFTLLNQRGEKVALSHFAGERVIVYFYPQDDTPGCTKEACQFDDELAGLRGLGVAVVGISPDDGPSHRSFVAKYALGFDLLSDPTHRVMERYGAWGEKMLYGKRVTGVIRSTFVIGPTGRIEHAWYAVRADGHAARVRVALAS
jgi:peroxiredoxin Q/BCP